MTAASGFFVGQIGAEIRLETNDSEALLIAATTKEIWYRTPESGTVGAWTATLSGTKLVYTTTAITDLPEAGEYQLQAYVAGVGWKLTGKKAAMLVEEPLQDIT